MQTKYLNRFFIFLVLVSICSCDMDLTMTDTKPNLQEPSEMVMKDLLTTAYSVLITDRSGYGNALWGGVDGCDTDESFNRNTNNSDVTTVGLHNCNSSSYTYILEGWRTFYTMIESCNIVIDMAKSVNMDNTKKADLVGQAITLRAFAHFMLAVHYGPVPIRKVPAHLMTNFDLPRDSIKNVCAFAVKELRDAVPMLNDITKTNTTTYVTKTVAEGLSLRVGLFMASHPDIKQTAMYDSVAVWGKQLIDKGTHSLNASTFVVAANEKLDVLPGYARVFVNNMMNNISIDNNKEGMWDCSFFMKSNLYGNYQSWNGGYFNALGSYIGIDCVDPSYTTSKIGYCSPQYRPHATLWKKYEPGDLRCDWNIAPYAYKDSTNTRYYYVSYTLPKTMGTPSTPAKLLFEVKGEKLVGATIVNGGAGYSDGTTHTMQVYGYNNVWSYPPPPTKTPTPPAATTSGTTFTITVAGGTITNLKMGTSATGYMNVYSRGIGKWRREYELNPTSPREQYNTSCNFPILRYADVLLMTAEAALFKSGGSGASVADGLSYVNLVRKRAGLGDRQSYDLAYIQDERSRELCFEGLRRMDLLRWGKDKYKAVYDQIVSDVTVYGSDGAASPAYKGDAGVNASGNNDLRPVYAIKTLMGNYEKFSLMPIPSNEIGRASNTFYQNPGW